MGIKYKPSYATKLPCIVGSSYMEHKNREPLITKQIKWPLYKKIKEICKENDYYLDHINGMEDHVHLLMEINPKFAISDVIKNIKGP